MPYAQVLIDRAAERLDKQFTYLIPEGMEVMPGQQVVVPFRNSYAEGFVISLANETELEPEKIKSITRLIRTMPVMTNEQLELAHWMAKRYSIKLVEAVRLMIPPEMRGRRVREKKRQFARLVIEGEALNEFIDNNKRAQKQLLAIELMRNGDIELAEHNDMRVPVKALVEKGVAEVYLASERRTPTALKRRELTFDPELTSAQQNALDKLTAAFEAGGGRFLLHGVTGSGKTEVYIRLIRRALERNKTAIVLVPEIALTPQMVMWFHGRFGGAAAVLHSGLSAGERYDEWLRIRTGEAKVVIGARSAVFAPLTDIGVVVVDEEHEHTYQSDNNPRYDAHDIAWQRAKTHGAVLILGSATPSVQTFMRAMPGVKPENRLTLLELPQRVGERPMPEVEIVDMRREFEKGNRGIFSGLLMRELKACLEAGGQAMLFINRRGHSTFVSCRQCGHVLKCGECDVSLTYHISTGELMCHYCGAKHEPPQTCPKCGSRYIKYFGAGTQKVQEEFTRLFPEYACERMDADTTRGKDAHAQILERFRHGETRVLIGTQMIAKGLDFPNVTLVGVVAADMSLNLPDYRSAERTFQLITQVAGRAGRSIFPGMVVVQTYEPEHYSISLAARQDYRAFFMRESDFRRKCRYPPFTVILRIIVSSVSEDMPRIRAEEIEKELNTFLDAGGHRDDIIQMRAVEAPIKRLRGETRWQVFCKMYFKGDIAAVTEKMQALADEAHEGVTAELQINPVNMF